MNFELVSLKLQVRPNDLDSLGHVNNATVLEYLETGRWDWLKYHNLQGKKSIFPVVARIEVNYRKEIIQENVVINTKLEEAKEPSHYQANFWQSIEIIKQGNPLVAIEARIKVVFIDSRERTLRTLQDFLEGSNE
ncbi:Thioesterase superfamily protein [Nostoc sp. DSM 114161]|jgi:YbgC/YbaW family acyl-CoA thioester hydrolase|uniref:acyl-CoA thioesterase n=1 Tax=Nostoc sp. DSM 114161 TaxID=3440143 RepID=UPI0040457877